MRSSQRNALIDDTRGGIFDNAVVSRHGETAVKQNIFSALDMSGPDNARIGDDQHAVPTAAVSQMAQLSDFSGTKDNLGAKR